MSGEDVRLRLDLAYDGSGFHGWAAQPGLRTVEGVISEALALVLRRPVQLTVAGRTDAGVHARAQTAHFELSATEAASFESAALLRRIQRLLMRGGEPDIVLRALTPVTADFDARFSASGRSYCYRLADAEAAFDPLARINVWWQPGLSLDTGAMAAAAESLLGEHDFLSFCRPREGATTIRTLTTLAVRRREDGVILLSPRADAFCHSMVRSLVGALVEVGRGKRDPEWLRTLVDRPSRSHGVPVVPACGLTLEGVEYPPPEEWGARAARARSKRILSVDGCC